jgi:hypothetical protein
MKEEIPMYSRYLTLQIKNNMVREFPHVFEKEILPLLRKQKGFLDELILAAPGKTEAIAISLWENKEFAEVYNREVYPEALKILNKYIEGVPVMKTFEVEYATFPSFQKFAAVATA